MTAPEPLDSAVGLTAEQLQQVEEFWRQVGRMTKIELGRVLAKSEARNRETAAEVDRLAEALTAERARRRTERDVVLSMVGGIESHVEGVRAALAGDTEGEQQPHVEPQHTPDCEEWCNHCTGCGFGVLYGSRCSECIARGVWSAGDPQ